MNNKYDAIVTGLGAMGAAALYQLAKKGAKVLGVDQFSPPHTFGSTHGETRITRKAIGEGDAYVPISLRSYDIWEELEGRSGVKLLEKCGGLIIANPEDIASGTHHGKYNFFGRTVSAAQRFGIKHEVLGADEIKKRFPQFNIRANEAGYYEPEAGYLFPERCVETQLRLAKEAGAFTRLNSKVTEVKARNGFVEVKLSSQSFFTERLIVTAGAWVSSFLPAGYAGQFLVYRQTLHRFEVAKEKFNDFKSGPIFIWAMDETEDNGFYGFPAVGEEPVIKLARERYIKSVLPDQVSKAVDKEEQESDGKFFERYLSGFVRKCLKSATCLYTSSPDGDFRIDYHPDNKSIIIASPCSGHGFKHSAAIGEALSELALEGKSTLDLSPFAFTSPSNIT